MTFKTFFRGLALCAALTFPSLASATTIDYGSFASFTGPPFSSDGMTVTGYSDVAIYPGVSIGIGDYSISGGEFINFAFDTPAAAVSYNVFQSSTLPPYSYNSGERILEAFGVGGASLGTTNQYGGGVFDVSAAFGNALIEGFRLTTYTETGFALDRISFESVSAVPLPAALPLYGAGLAVMGFIGWRRKRKTA